MSRYGGDYSSRQPERWDRSRFEAAERGGPVMEREVDEEVVFRRRERSPPAPVRREQERYDFVERPRRERYYEEERDPYAGAMVHRPREREPPREERDLEIDIRRREYDDYDDRSERRAPASRGGRPTFIRRQSSLDTHDRRPLPRYGDRVREEPATTYIQTDRRRRESVRREDYDDVRVQDPGYYGDETYRGYREREVERVRRRRSPSHSSGSDTERETVREEVKEEVTEEDENPFPRKGKTRMPQRLVNKRAIIQLGYPFEEEDETTIIILKALNKPLIDEVFDLSKEMNKEKEGVVEERKTTYVFEKNSPSPSPKEVPRSVREWDVMSMGRKSSKSKARSPSPPSEASHHSHRSRRRSSHHKSSRARSVSTGSAHRAIIIEERDESSSLRAGLGALVPASDNRRRSKSISKELKSLQAERRALQLEREAEALRGENEEGALVITRDRDDVVEVKKDKKAPDPRIIRAMLATLT